MEKSKYCSNPNKLYQAIGMYLFCLYAVKVLESLYSTNFSDFFRTEICLSKHQSGFRPGDSCIYQFDCNPSLEARGVFLDISKAFNRVWHKELLFKLKQNGVSGNLFQLTTGLLNDRFVDFKVLYSTIRHQIGKLGAGVPQGSILRPLFFLICTNDSTTNSKSYVKLFADDTSLSSEICDPLETANILNNDLSL